MILPWQVFTQEVYLKGSRNSINTCLFDLALMASNSEPLLNFRETKRSLRYSTIRRDWFRTCEKLMEFLSDSGILNPHLQKAHLFSHSFSYYFFNNFVFTFRCNIGYISLAFRRVSRKVFRNFRNLFIVFFVISHRFLISNLCCFKEFV